MCTSNHTQECPARQATRTNDTLPTVTFRKAFIAGVSQAIAVIPGISRSGYNHNRRPFIRYVKGRCRKVFLLVVLARSVWVGKSSWMLVRLGSRSTCGYHSRADWMPGCFHHRAVCPGICAKDRPPGRIMEVFLLLLGSGHL